MKKFLLSVIIMTTAFLQAKAQENYVPMMQLTPAKSIATTVHNTAPRRTLGTNQKYMGPHESDELGVNSHSYVDKAGFKLGVMLPANYVSKFDGCKIVGMRLATWKAMGAVRVFAIDVNNGVIGNDVVSQEVDSTVVGWNEVKIANPYTISADGTNTLLIGYEFKDKLDYYPCCVAGEGYEGGVYHAYQNFAWRKEKVNQYGNLNVQCIVEKDGIQEAVDVTVKSVSVPAVAKKGETTKVKFQAYNFSNAATTCNFGISIDGNEVATLNGCTVKGDTTTLSADVNISSAYTVGQPYELAVYLKSVNGATPAGDTTDDRVTSSFKPYSKTAQRQLNLLEEATATWCYACTLADKGITQLMEQRDDIAWVAMHTWTDLRVTGTQYLRSFFDYSGLPNGTFNRCFLDGKDNIVYSLGWTNINYLVGMLNDNLDESIKKCPTFAELSLSTIYDEVSRVLTITVKGTGVENAAKLMNDDILTVYLTEDNVVATQWNGHEYDEDYVHHGVVRSVLTGKYGDNISWDGDNFEMTYSATLDNTWDAMQMYVVAATSRQFYDSTNSIYKRDKADAWVSNAAQAAVKNSTSCIGGAVVEDGARTVVGYYTVDGQRISKPQKGINIIRFSNGTTKKVLQK